MEDNKEKDTCDNVENTENIENAEKTEADEKTENLENTENIDENKNDEKNDSDAETNKEIEYETKIKELEDKYRRLLAEFDNFRKRSEKENAQMIDIGATHTLNKILPIVDNLERALSAVPDDMKNNPVAEGLDKTYKQVLKTFEELQVKPIEALNKPFDAEFHNAVMTDEASDAEVDTITEVLQKGYMYKEQVLRHAMVKVKK